MPDLNYKNEVSKEFELQVKLFLIGPSVAHLSSEFRRSNTFMDLIRRKYIMCLRYVGTFFLHVVIYVH